MSCVFGFFFVPLQVDQFGSLGLTMTVLILATTACGALLAWLLLLRLTGKERRTLVIEIGMQPLDSRKRRLKWLSVLNPHKEKFEKDHHIIK